MGSGGREHALRDALAPTADEVVVSPGNAGIRGSTDSAPEDIDADLFVIGPEVPLVGGMADRLRAGGRLVFGPGADGALLEGSKSWMKDVLVESGVPTARHATFSEPMLALAFLQTLDPPYVVKTDGLAAGKGVLVTESFADAADDVRSKLSGTAFGDAGRRVVIEEGLGGPELSLLCICDGRRAVPLAPAQDFKRLGDGNTGPNTGGMGAYSPAAIVTPAVHARIMREVITPAVNGMAADGTPYTGFLYAGVMIDPAGNPLTLEFNCRLGDPETQPMMMRLKSDLVDLLEHGIDGTLDTAEAEWDRRAALGVVLAARGYPDRPKKGDVISGLDAAPPDCKVFHSGTSLDGGRVVSNGGRVLCVTALGETVRQAQRAAYAAISAIHFDGMQFRKDIGRRAILPRKP